MRERFDKPLDSLDAQLAQVSDACAVHTERVKAMDKLLARVNSELVEISLSL